jgi:predicted nucleic acid-binding protein
LKRKIISNTGPLIALAIVNKLDILRLLFESVVVPQAVHEEILQGGQLNKGLVLYQNSQWIQVRQLSESPDILLNSVLDKGEASVIQLARECKADIVLIDERKGRKIARDIYRSKTEGIYSEYPGYTD